MRWICWILVLPAVGALAATAAALEPVPDHMAAYAGRGHHHAQGTSVCGRSFHGSKPGCCQCGPSACDNAWAGYCQEKAHWQNFWNRVGTGTMGAGTLGYHTAGYSVQPTPAREEAAVYLPPVSTEPAVHLPPVSAEPAPVAPLPPLPRPVPEKTSWHWHNLWQR